MIKMVLRGVLVLVAIVCVVILMMGLMSRRLPDLKLWHRVVLQEEFRAKNAPPGMTFDDYLTREQQVFDELDAKVYQQMPPEEQLPYNRFYHKSYSFPDNFARNWNRSFELIPTSPIRGGVLMLHGLTDSPYSNHALAQVLYEHGYYVLGLRYPGHGTIPSGMMQCSWEDWEAAAKMALEHVRKKIGDARPLYLCGYSTGGSLALKMTFDALSEQRKTADKVFLFSPAIEVSPFGVLADWYKPIGWLPFFEKSPWKDVNPEYDPFKYNSFANHAGGEVYKLANIVQGQVEDLRKKGLLAQAPPIIAFQSVVDTTVVGSALVKKLYGKLEPNNSKLVIFDVNHDPQVEPFIKTPYKSVFSQFEAYEQPLPFELTIVTNATTQTPEVVAETRKAGEKTFQKTPLSMSWPSQVYSLSHVSLLFPPDDPLYGGIETRALPASFKIGTLTPKGELSVLNVSIQQLMRLRYNPFFDYLTQQVLTEMQK
ncbi:hypothetical protein U14_00351 [Candidatus Moduliflexus flocculans]|uniref:Serine aminopeptidase S33 domain-containing protein n=1 Tax=Candidatus Moduliflexus flocculans TaxID=1499966 RepID=A0A0S6VPT2_9BACT|nr:hypothetical protein U14_00351 [Candidatus Moduliflexus flocculans]